ncbi:monovalent cation/H(+) antiporter subunit G [Corynebacterium uberis]|uniref:monovalent cation/H(+) antiporter subunit G n=1 Tax=Corynebacterium TaxID=1716 RepID=UPI001D0AE9A5|nr:MULTISPECIES: monovalent cation/H(+) antiporter subunit G [Corynebacterium]MCZ9309723.1 monovalent cation/H(+) antiporter subunit G [Corynebacterium sp. c6VSa_13]UDL73527.1 monovalent cation/H(+) antiporter subunit G [Corynebacterium uberis]UDL75593.1 monovalent cation/H(+) antiporter subunit G [Corynebacterium uberis]UDL77806.1 monovalent cation/H(+) antiporter subunit G [Corynebacterium uberis]UDL80089.1 monovalent cation/H(+) antiporter subunit G [Corynebacterium uberis]
MGQIIHYATDVISLVFIIVGAGLVFSAAVGLVRFGDTMSRIHAITKPQSSGLILTILGAIIRVAGAPDFGTAERGDMGVLVLLVLFAFITGPVTAQRLGRIARREGLYAPKESMTRNDAPAGRALTRRREPVDTATTAARKKKGS